MFYDCRCNALWIKDFFRVFRIEKRENHQVIVLAIQDNQLNYLYVLLFLRIRKCSERVEWMNERESRTEYIYADTHKKTNLIDRK